MSLERELKYAVPRNFTPSKLGEAVETLRLTSTYFDTPDLALLAAGVTLRRREGDADVGWQLKVPAGADAREEIARPLTRRPPAALTKLLVGLIDEKTLTEVARIETTRGLAPVHRDETLVAHVAIDDVHATRTASGDAVAWSEVEVELTDAGRRRDLDRVEKQLVEAGARRSTAPNKLARTLDRRPVELTGADTVVGDYLSESAQRLVAGDIALRRGLGDIHQIRVAVRRVRSALRVFASVLRDTTLVDDLSPYQNLLGDVRDREVQRRHFAAAVADLPPEIALGPVAATIDQELLSAQQQAATALREALDAPAYLDAFRATLAIAAQPVTRPDTDESDLVRLARRARRKAAKRLRHADDDITLHRARKATKRARYAAELVGASGKTIKRYKKVQDVLGEHQDAVVAAEVLLQLARRVGPRSGQNAFGYGVLFQRELDIAADRRAAGEKLRLPR